MNDLPVVLVQYFSPVLTENVLRYVIGAGGTYLVVNLIFARYFASRQVRSCLRPGWPQMRREIMASLRTVLIFSVCGLGIVAGATLGELPIYTDLATYGLGWFFFTILAIILAHDAWFYWTHRYMHRPRLFQLFHRMHHRSHKPSPFAAYSFDTSEAVVQTAFLPLFLYFVPMHPLAIFVFTGHMMLRNAIGHSGVEFFPAARGGGPLFGFLTTVTHHDLHHESAHWNLGLYFTWWDRICGTEHPDYLARFRAATGKVAGMVLALSLFAGTPATAQVAGGNWATEDLAIVLHLVPCQDTAALVCGQTVFRRDAGDKTAVRGKALMLKAGMIDLITCKRSVCSHQILHSTRWLETVAARFVTAP